LIVIWGTPLCRFCEKAKTLAEQYNLTYEYVDATTSKDLFLKTFPNATTVPQITWGGRYVGGYCEFAIEVENTIGGYGKGAF